MDVRILLYDQKTKECKKDVSRHLTPPRDNIASRTSQSRGWRVYDAKPLWFPPSTTQVSVPSGKFFSPFWMSCSRQRQRAARREEPAQHHRDFKDSTKYYYSNFHSVSHRFPAIVMWRGTWHRLTDQRRYPQAAKKRDPWKGGQTSRGWMLPKMKLFPKQPHRKHGFERRGVQRPDDPASSPPHQCETLGAQYNEEVDGQWQFIQARLTCC